MPADALRGFSEPTRAWFASAFRAPTPVQAGAWQAVRAGGSVLAAAPTGSGKTLAAFLAALDRLVAGPPAGQNGVRVLYVSPLKALAYDIDRNLRAPLAGIRLAAERRGLALADVTVGLRTGDTPAAERQRLIRHPPDILITTPESLFLLLTSRARDALASVETVIVDEVHAVAGTKRGAHLAVSLERLDAQVAAAGREPLQRIGLSATQRPLTEIGRFLAGGVVGPDGSWQPRDVTIVDAQTPPALDVEVVVPVEDMGALGELDSAADAPPQRSIWPAVHPRVLELIRAHRSVIVFANSRRLAERLCASLNELAGETVARAHHGSVAPAERALIEDDLKAGRLRCVVATSSLELGIDMGAVDLVIQVESPRSVARGLQRIGRAGHHVDAPSVGKVFPKYRGDLVDASVVVSRMRRGEIEETQLVSNPLDVLAQQAVAMAAMDAWSVGDLLRVVRGAANFAGLSRPQLEGVLDMLSGRYPSDEFAELRPRLVWDRIADRVTGRAGAQRLAVTSGGTIPDRGLYGVFVAGEGPNRRVGELDEEMVYETRPGEVITLGASSWRVEDITRDQVLVSPAPGEPGKLPFWHGDAPGRPAEMGRAVGAFLRSVAEGDRDEVVRQLVGEGLDDRAARNVVAYVAEQQEATGVVPTDRHIVFERFRDEIGDWRVCLLSPYGARVHAPWALAIEAQARARLGLEVHTMYADDGIVVRLPDQSAWDGPTTQSAWDGPTTEDQAPPLDAFLVAPDEVEDLVVSQLTGSPLFASRFREAAARALLLPRRRPGQRTPLWQQRQRAADLLAVASRYGSFPILLETHRECLQDVFDVPALVALLRDIEARRIHVTQVETPAASPFAASLLFGYVAAYLYEGDAPLAERRAQALSLDRRLLADLLGTGEFRELVDAEALEELELELQRLTPDRHARDRDHVSDLLREIGDLRPDEVAARTHGPGEAWLAELAGERRAIRLRVAGEERWAAAEDAGRFRDALGIPPPPGLPQAFLEPVDRPTVDLVARYARTHGPFTDAEVAERLGLARDALRAALEQLLAEGRVVVGAFRPGGAGDEYCDTEVLRRIRRRSLAALRQEVEPVDAEALGRFLPAWQGVGPAPGGVSRTLEAITQLQGAPIPASVLERDVLASRVRGYAPAWLDELCGTGEVVWVGHSPLGAADGRVALYLRAQAPLIAAVPGKPQEEEWWSELHEALLAHLEDRGASFWPQLYAAAGGGSEPAVLTALWDLVWAGLVTNDSPAPLRALAGGARPGGRGRHPRRPGRVSAGSGPPAAAGRWSLVAELVHPLPSSTERAAALAAQLLDRHGVVVRDAVVAEGAPGGYATVYPVLKAMEEAGRARRGYFIEGLGAAQFALPGAVDRIRDHRKDAAGAVVLAATDPANPYGAALPWPEPAAGHLPRRAAGAYVVLHAGALAGYLERGGRSLLLFTESRTDHEAVSSELASLATSGRVRRLLIERVDGTPAAEHSAAACLRAAGFADHPGGLVRRPRLE